MEPPGKKRVPNTDTRIVRMFQTAPGGEAKRDNDVKTVLTERRAKKRTPIAVQRDDDEYPWPRVITPDLCCRPLSLWGLSLLAAYVVGESRNERLYTNKLHIAPCRFSGV